MGEPWNKVDLTGQRFGMLAVIGPSRSRTKHGLRKWRCRCDCGGERVVIMGNLRSGNTASCGCTRGTANRRHALTGTPIYNIWRTMIQRCTNPRSTSWARYGARGIKVSERWRSFDAFYADMGARPSERHSLDRYPNRDGDYEPGNVRWATPTEQMRNRSDNRILEFRGVRACMIEWAERTGIDYQGIYRRLKSGWSVERALSTPIGGAS